MRHRAVNALWTLAARPAERRLRQALADPARVQGARLRGLLRANARCAFGRRHRFERLDSVARFQREVPLTRYADYEDAVAAIRRGEHGVLCTERVGRLVPSGGSTGPCKLVPHTASLAREMNEAIGAWIVDLYRRDPRLARGPAYWSVSPALDGPVLPSAVPIGFDGDARYLGRTLGPLVDRLLVAPAALARVRPPAAFQYATLLLLLRAAGLRLISVWHPSFFTVLWDARAALWERLVADVAAGTVSPPGAPVPALGRRLRPDPRRARALAALGPEAPAAACWPELRLVSAWGDAGAGAAFEGLAPVFDGVALQPKGLLSTEAFVTVPYAGQRPLAITAHFYEFLDDEGRALTAEALVRGGEYEVVVTTGGGLYRYRTGDRVRVEGHLGRTPSLRFLGRVDQVVDLGGEKLHEAWVGSLLEELRRDRPAGFAMLAPDARGYTLYTDARPDDAVALAGSLAGRLRESPGFAYAEDLGQLAPLRVFRIDEPAHAAYLRRMAGRGAVLGAVKPVRLSALDGWSAHFRGDYLAPGGPARVAAFPSPREQADAGGGAR